MAQMTSFLRIGAGHYAADRIFVLAAIKEARASGDREAVKSEQDELRCLRWARGLARGMTVQASGMVQQPAQPQQARQSKPRQAFRVTMTVSGCVRILTVAAFSAPDAKRRAALTYPAATGMQAEWIGAADASDRAEF